MPTIPFDLNKKNYSEVFSHLYQELWGDYPTRYAQSLIQFIKPKNYQNILDLCCGTGHFSRILAQHQYKVMGLDLSPNMIARAKEESKKLKLKIKYIQAHASHFNLNKKFDVIISTYDALNHLYNEKELDQCFQKVSQHLDPKGLFIFDLNTQKGLKEKWDTQSSIKNTSDLFLMMSGQYLESQDSHLDKAVTRITGFKRKNSSSFFERFDEKIYNTVFPMKLVLHLLKKNKFQNVCCFANFNFTSHVPKQELENQPVVYFVADLQR